MKDENMREIEKLWYRISKSTTGAVFNIRQTNAEILIGIPPPHETNLVNTIIKEMVLILERKAENILNVSPPWQKFK